MLCHPVVMPARELFQRDETWRTDEVFSPICLMGLRSDVQKYVRTAKLPRLSVPNEPSLELYEERMDEREGVYVYHHVRALWPD